MLLMIPQIIIKIMHLNAKNIRLGRKSIGYHYPVYFIAEAGVNHNGNINLALKMIEVAKQINWIPSFGLERELDWNHYAVSPGLF